MALCVLGIETSCDETAAAVVGDDRRILSNVVHSQLAEHAPYGGVVPEIAARAHLRTLDAIIRRALDDAGLALSDIDAVGATGGPGLIGGVIVGVMTAKALAATRDIPFVAVNHLEAHALTARLTDGVGFPYLLLLVSGGHCQLTVVEGVGRYTRLGATVDDAVGEAFDKTAKMLGLGYPGGPAVEAAARAGDPARFRFPRPMTGRSGSDFSFSGLKTAVRQAILDLPDSPLGDRDRQDICAGFQAAVADVLEDRCRNALGHLQATGSAARTLVVAGGVAANAALRSRLSALCDDAGFRFCAPPLALCTDNAAMIAWAAAERLSLGLSDGLDFAPRPRWPLEDLAAAG